MLALVVDTSAHPRAMCYKCYNESIPSHTRLALNEFQASCYSHHRSQSALSETNWLLRVSGCNPYLESLPSYIDGAPPWTPTKRGHGITSLSLKHDPEISPRDSKELRTNTNQSYSINQERFIMHINLMPTFLTKSSFIFDVESIPTHHSQSMNIEFHLIPISCHFDTNHFIEITCQDLSKLIIHNSYTLLLMHIHSSHALT